MVFRSLGLASYYYHFKNYKKGLNSSESFVHRRRPSVLLHPAALITPLAFQGDQSWKDCAHGIPVRPDWLCTSRRSLHCQQSQVGCWSNPWNGELKPLAPLSILMLLWLGLDILMWIHSEDASSRKHLLAGNLKAPTSSALSERDPLSFIEDVQAPIISPLLLQALPVVSKHPELDLHKSTTYLMAVIE